MGNFYINIKISDEHLRFVFMTGVTKFSKVSVFSKLNNLRDITMSGAFATSQIKEKGYANPYLSAGKPITLIGINFSKKKRNIVEWLEEEIV